MSHILVVEDEEGIREALVEILSRNQHVVQSAKHGQDALDLLHSSTQLPQLIILDIFMPVMDGKTFLGHVGRDPKINNIPVLVVTGSEEVLSGLPKNSRAFRKPFPVRDLLLAVTEILAAENGRIDSSKVN